MRIPLQKKYRVRWSLKYGECHRDFSNIDSADSFFHWLTTGTNNKTIMVRLERWHRPWYYFGSWKVVNSWNEWKPQDSPKDMNEFEWMPCDESKTRH